jgi:hypothetical protein
MTQIKLSIEESEMVNRAAAGIMKLEPKHAPRSESTTRLILSVVGEIRAARLKGVSYEDIARSLRESTGIKLSGITLKRRLAAFDEEEKRKTDAAARAIAANLARRNAGTQSGGV